MRSYPDLLRILRDEFESKAPFTDEVLAQIEARLLELEPGRKLHVLTMGRSKIMGVAEGDL